MVSQAGPHELLKMILQGAASPRPLFLPIAFSHAARIENLPLRAFLTNPTKITQALRQIRGHLRSDGLTCYFDPYLEMEALGAELDWGSGNKPTARWVHDPLSGGLPGVDDLATKGRIPAAVEVIRRMKSLVRDEVLLTAAVSGPFRLAAQFVRAEGEKSGEEISPAALALASEAIMPVASAFVEAGANVVLIMEELPFSAPCAADLVSLLATTINIVRFYQAMPVLLLNSGSEHQGPAPQTGLDCVVCPELSETAPKMPVEMVKPAPTTLGVAIPVGVISRGQPGIEKFCHEFRRLNPGFQPALITTSDEVPATADLRNWNKLCELLTA